MRHKVKGFMTHRRIRELTCLTRQREAPRAWQRRLSSREDRPPAAPSWTRLQCPMNTTVAVSQRAQASEDALSETGQQEADADQGSKGGNKSDRSTNFYPCRDRRKIKR